MWLLIGISVSLGVAYAPWMASFTETVEQRNPALTATGLAVWGLVIRIVIAVSVFFVPHRRRHRRPRWSRRARWPRSWPKKYAPQLATAAKLDPATSAALAKNPTDPATGAKAVSEVSGCRSPTSPRSPP